MRPIGRPKNPEKLNALLFVPYVSAHAEGAHKFNDFNRARHCQKCPALLLHGLVFLPQAGFNNWP